jgi:hypothetical protein
MAVAATFQTHDYSVENALILSGFLQGFRSVLFVKKNGKPIKLTFYRHRRPKTAKIVEISDLGALTKSVHCTGHIQDSINEHLVTTTSRHGPMILLCIPFWQLIVNRPNMQMVGKSSYPLSNVTVRM